MNSGTGLALPTHKTDETFADSDSEKIAPPNLVPFEASRYRKLCYRVEEKIRFRDLK
jgi:hypothetical protein